MHMTPWDDACHGPLHHLGMELDATDRSRAHVRKLHDIAPAALETATMHCTQSVKTLTMALQGLTHQLMQLLSGLRFVQQANLSGWHVLLQRFKLYRCLAAGILRTSLQCPASGKQNAL